MIVTLKVTLSDGINAFDFAGFVGDMEGVEDVEVEDVQKEED